MYILMIGLPYLNIVGWHMHNTKYKNKQDCLISLQIKKDELKNVKGKNGTKPLMLCYKRK